MEESGINRRWLKAKRSTTKSGILRKITNKIIYDSAEFKLDPKLLVKENPTRKPMVPSYGAIAQEFNFYYFHTNSRNNFWFFLYCQHFHQMINTYPISKFNAIRIILYKLKLFLGPDFETHMDYFHFMDRICRMQKYYWTLRRFVMHCQYKRAKVQIDHDLYMTPIDIRRKDSFSLLQNGKLYYFVLTNLSKIIINAITNTQYFFITPKPIKNPHNNMELKINDLYNIYFKMRVSNIPIPTLFSQFFLVNFNVGQFKMKYTKDIHNYYINSFVDNATIGELIGYAFELIEMVDKQHIWDFDEDFPDEIVVRELKPYIKLYLLYSYSVDSGISQTQIMDKLGIIIKANPEFGKKKIENRFIPNPGFHDRLFPCYLIRPGGNYYLTSHNESRIASERSSPLPSTNTPVLFMYHPTTRPSRAWVSSSEESDESVWSSTTEESSDESVLIAEEDAANLESHVSDMETSEDEGAAEIQTQDLNSDDESTVQWNHDDNFLYTSVKFYMDDEQSEEEDSYSETWHSSDE